MTNVTQRQHGSWLDSPSLVLNKNWMAIDATTVRNALVDVVAEKAKIIGTKAPNDDGNGPELFALYDIDEWIALGAAETDPHIRTLNGRIRVPRVILSQHKSVPKRKVVFSRRNLWRRDNYQCQYCGIRPPKDEITIDHVLPKSKGGKTTFANTVLACIDCNKRKDNRTPEEAGMRLRRTVRSKSGIETIEYYLAPKAPGWSPIYAVKRQKIPLEWSNFLQGIIDDLYWDTELEP